MSGISAFGTLLQLSDGASPPAYTTVAQLTNITGPTMESEQLDVSSHDSTGGYREFVPGISNPGTVSIEGNFDPAGATHMNASGGLLYIFEQKTVNDWKIVWPDTGSTEWTFSASIVSFETQAPFDGALTFSAELLISGQPTLA